MELVIRKPYRGRYPSAAEHLLAQGVISRPRQVEKEQLKKHWGLDINYTLHGMTPAAFNRHVDSLLLLAYQEAMRYEEYHWKFAEFEVRLGRIGKGRTNLPQILTYTAAMHPDGEIMVYGPGYEVPQRHFLYHKIEDILDITKRYPGQVSKQKPYKVLRMSIKIRENK